MKTAITIFSILIIGCLAISCNSKKKQTEQVNQIKIDQKNQSLKTPYKDIIDTIFYIPLETSDHSIIGNIEMLKVTRNGIFILDGIQGTVLKFSSEGKFIFKIPIGKGPGELIRPKWLTINEKEEALYVLDNTKGALIKYNIHGKFDREIKLKFTARSVQCLQNNKGFAFYTGYIKNKTIEKNGSFANLIITDSNGKVISTIFPFDNDVNLFNFVGISDVYSVINDEVYLFCQFFDRIYKIDQYDTRPIYEINYGNNNQIKSDNYYKEISENKIHDFNYINNKRHNSNIYNLYAHKQTLSHLYLTGVYNKNSFFYYYDKVTKNVYEINTNEVGILPFFCIDSNENYFISYITIDKIMKNSSEFSKNKILSDMINSYNINSNPIITFFRLKAIK